MPSRKTDTSRRGETPRARKCPVCGGSSRERLYRQSFADVKKVSFLKGYDVVVCKRCGFGYADGIPSQQAFNRYYERQSKYENLSSASSRSRQDSLENGRRFIKSFVNDTGISVLEIGCGAGDFLRHLKDSGFTDLTALEPSQSAVDSLLRKSGIKAMTGTLSKTETNATFDLVVLITVLEHVVALYSAIKNLSHLLGSSGLLFIRVPDACRFPDFDDSPFQQFSPEHINYFSTVSARNLLVRHGYTLLGSEEVSLRESDNSILPMINLMFRKNGHKNRFLPERDRLTKYQLAKYIALSAAKEREVQGKIEPYTASQEPIVVWGVGTHTLRLLELGALKKCNIAAFIDSNKHYAGGLFNNIPVFPPSELHRYPHKILVSSKVYQKEIADFIRNTLKAPNELILLYSQTNSGNRSRKSV